MLFGLICGLIYYLKNREYRIDEKNYEDFFNDFEEIIIDFKYWLIFGVGIIVLIV